MNRGAWVVSPAAGRCLSGRPFLLEGRLARVVERFASPDGIQSDVLDIRFEGTHVPCQTGMLGTTVGSLEQRINDGQVEFLQTAAAFNSLHRWPNHVDDLPLGYRDFARLASVEPTRSKDHITPEGRIIAGTAPESATLTKFFNRRCFGSQSSVDRHDRAANDAGTVVSLKTKFVSATRTTHSQPMSQGRAALLSILASNRWTFVTEVSDLLWDCWQREWGVKPSYRTILRWVKEAQASPSAVTLDDLPSHK